ncbi:uncharacterized protein PAC_10376 [Phialocephala subalpina]|uniref:Uncharacterized protein n=1 Tax=Phialocephala subalpina TaxID=576137 RepID=A0A1L7X626_9HELO|nr:uncharacterized protein PAC_10376 [Phialocephala subalpina]
MKGLNDMLHCEREIKCCPIANSIYRQLHPPLTSSTADVNTVTILHHHPPKPTCRHECTKDETTQEESRRSESRRRAITRAQEKRRLKKSRGDPYPEKIQIQKRANVEKKRVKKRECVLVSASSPEGAY